MAGVFTCKPDAIQRWSDR